MEQNLTLVGEIEQLLSKCHELQIKWQFLNGRDNMENDTLSIFHCYKELPSLSQEFHNCITSNGPNFNFCQSRIFQLIQEYFSYVDWFSQQIKLEVGLPIRQQVKIEQFNLMKYVCHVDLSTQILKKNTNFNATFRCLSVDEMSMTKPVVNCILVSGDDIKKLLENLDPFELARGLAQDIKNSKAKMEYHEGKRCAQFKQINIQKKINFKSKSSVLEEKCALLFFTKILIDRKEMTIFALSKPVVQITHSSQERWADCTLFWVTYFPEVSEEPFKAKESVTCQDLTNALVTEFETRTKHPLCDISKEFIKENIDQLREGNMITRTKISKKTWKSTHSFYEWFYNLMKLLTPLPNVDEKKTSSIQKMWKANLITGIISSSKAALIIQNYPVGTFLIRFSETKLSALNVVCKTSDTSVEVTIPWDPKVVELYGLANLILEVEGTKFLMTTFSEEVVERNQALKDYLTGLTTEQYPKMFTFNSFP